MLENFPKFKILSDAVTVNSESKLAFASNSFFRFKTTFYNSKKAKSSITEEQISIQQDSPSKDTKPTKQSDQKVKRKVKRMSGQQGPFTDHFWVVKKAFLSQA